MSILDTRELEKITNQAGVLPFGIIAALSEEEWKNQVKFFQDNKNNKQKLNDYINGANYEN
jgi:hypothetical protein